MKKTLLVFLAIALVGSFAFAEASISGDVTLTAGYDLDNESYGFVNDSSIQVILPILSAEGGASGDDGVYAEISVTDIGWEWNYDEGGFYDTFDESDAVYADISATIYFNGMYMGLGAPDFEINNVDVSDDYSVDANADASLATGGFTLGFANDMLDVSFMIASERDYRDDTDDDISAEVDDDHTLPFNNDIDTDEEDDDYEENADGELVYGISATITPAEGVTIPFSFFMDPKSDAIVSDIAANSTGAQAEDLIAFGMAPSVVMGDLTFDLPVDYVKYGDQSGYELQPAVSYAVMEGLSVSADFLYGSYTDVLAADVEGTSDIENAVAEVTFGVADSEAFVPGLSWALDVTAWNLMDYTDTGLDTTPVEVEFEASFMTGGMKPYMSAVYSLYHAQMELGLGVELGADFTGIDNTAITIDYYNDSMVNGEVDDLVALGADDDETESGRLTVAIVVSF